MARWAALAIVGPLLFQSSGAVARSEQREAAAAVESALPEHESIWARQGLAVPVGDTRVLLFFISSHHLTFVRSLVATRGHDGRWNVQAIDEQRPGMVGSGVTATRLPRRSLSTEDSRRLDRLLAGRSLYAEPVRQGSRPDQLGVGATFVTVEITTPSARRTSMLAGKWTGRTGDVVRLLSPRD